MTDVARKIESLPLEISSNPLPGARFPANEVSLNRVNLLTVVNELFTPQKRIERTHLLQTKLTARGPDKHFLGGIVHEELDLGKYGKHNVVHIGNPYQKDYVDSVMLPTRCTKAEVDTIRQRIVPMEETYQMLFKLAKAYEQRSPAILEGGTSIGKTFAINRFAQLLYGPHFHPVDFYCSGQTDVSELMGKYVPKAMLPEDRQRLNDFIFSPECSNWLKELRSQGTFGALTEFETIYRLAAERLKIPLSKSEFEFQSGAMPIAAMAEVDANGKIRINEHGGPGTILHVQEVGHAEPAVTNALLLLGGEQGQLPEAFQLFQDGGRTIKLGPDFFVAFSTNPPERGYLERKEIDPSLARRCVWLRIDDLSDTSLQTAADKIFNYQLGEFSQPASSTFVDLRAQPEICAELASIAKAFHGVFKTQLANGEQGGRRQKIPASLDDLSRLATYLQTSQVPALERGCVDFAETLRRGIKYVYLDRLAEQKLKDDLQKALETELTGDTIGAKKDARGKIVSRADYLNELSKKACATPQTLKIEGEIKESKEEVREKLVIQTFDKLKPIILRDLSLDLKIAAIRQASNFLNNSEKALLLEELENLEAPSEPAKLKVWQKEMAELGAVVRKTINTVN